MRTPFPLITALVIISTINRQVEGEVGVWDNLHVIWDGQYISTQGFYSVYIRIMMKRGQTFMHGKSQSLGYLHGANKL